jgi:predicted dehydrogenase
MDGIAMDNRRDFLKTVTVASSVVNAPAMLAQQNAGSNINVAVIGVGTRGIYLLEEVQRCAGVQVRWISDLYDSNLQRAVKACKNTKVQTTKEWEKAATASDVDAVIIATPDFWHARMSVRAAEAKKHVYVEKGLCRTLDEAKAIRRAVKDNKIVLQLGHNQNSDPTYIKAREIYESGKLGKVTLARTYIDRTSQYPEWQFYTAYNINEVPKDANAQTIDWNRWIANAPERPFDVERFFRWRCFWEYGTGIAGDLMSHQWDGVNCVMNMGIPEAVITQGGLYFWKADRTVPDQWHVMFEYPKKDFAIQFNCTFHSRHQGTNTYILGRDGSLEVGGGHCRVYDAEWKPESMALLSKLRREASSAGRDPELVTLPPTYRMKRGELEVTNHVQNWIDCVRSRETPRCGIDRAFDEAVTIVMSVESYFKERKVKWDPVNEVII